MSGFDRAARRRAARGPAPRIPGAARPPIPPAVHPMQAVLEKRLPIILDVARNTGLAPAAVLDHVLEAGLRSLDWALTVEPVLLRPYIDALAAQAAAAPHEPPPEAPAAPRDPNAPTAEANPGAEEEDSGSAWDRILANRKLAAEAAADRDRKEGEAQEGVPHAEGTGEDLP